MGPVKHSIASGFISLIFGWITKSFSGTVACFLSGIFIDIDHIYDFWINKKKLFSSYKEFYSYFAHEKDGKLYLILHSYEILILLWMIIFYYKLGHMWTGIAIGMSTHLMFDRFTNPLKANIFFLCYRIRHKFEKKHTYTDKEYSTLR